jgi:hypothetical protein
MLSLWLWVLQRPFLEGRYRTWTMPATRPMFAERRNRRGDYNENSRAFRSAFLAQYHFWIAVASSMVVLLGCLT